MYEVYWQLKKRPFGEWTSPALFYPAGSHKKALSRLSYVIQEQKGIALLVGPYGVGKTITLNTLLAGMDKQRYHVARIMNPQLTDSDLLLAVAREFNIDTDSTSKPILYDLLKRQFLEWVGQGIRPVLLIEDAHVIVGRRELVILQSLLPIEHQGRPVLTMILCGSAYLYRRIRTVRGLGERISVCVSMNPLEENEIRPYLDHLMKLAGGSGDIFSDDAVTAVYSQSGGYPRRINRIAELALVVGAAYDVKQIDQTIVHDVSIEVVARSA